MEIFTPEIMDPLFWILEQSRGVEQGKEHHPEGDVFTHSLQAVYCAFRETTDTDLILAAMLHDVGKIARRMGHANESVKLLDCHCSAKTLWLIRNHLRLWNFMTGEMKKLSKIKGLIEHPWFTPLAHLGRIDKEARSPTRRIAYCKQDIVDRLNRCVEPHFEPPMQQSGLDRRQEEIREMTPAEVVERTGMKYLDIPGIVWFSGDSNRMYRKIP